MTSIAKVDSIIQEVERKQKLNEERNRETEEVNLYIVKNDLKIKNVSAFRWRRAPENIFKQYMKDAKKRNISFELTFEEFSSFQNKCFYCGDEFYGIRLDRVDNTKGYIKENVVSCCLMCNKMKANLKIDNFKEHIKKIYMKNDETQNVN